jgi:hypothetical protein
MIYCNQYSLIIETELSEDIINKKIKESELNLADIMTLENKITFHAPKLNNVFIPEDKHIVLNDILKVSLYTLYLDKCSVSRSEYKFKKPFYLIFIELRDKQCSWTTLSKIQQSSKKIIHLSARFDTEKKNIKIVLKIKF